MQMKRIAFFNSSKSWGGGEKWHFEMSLALRNYGFETVVFAYENTPLYAKAKNAGLECIGIKISNTSFMNPVAMKNLSSLLKRQNLDAIILNMPADVKSAGVVAMRLGIKHVIYRRGSAIPIKNSFLNRYLFGNVITEMIANSEETKRTILQNNSKLFDAEKITVIYNGIDIEQFDNAGKYHANARSNEIFTIGNLARLSYQKGQHYLLDLAKMLKDRGRKFRMLIGGEGELGEDLKLSTTRLGIDDCVIFTGFEPNPYEFLQRIDILVFPSIWEGFGYSIVEAKLSCKPVVAFDVSSNPEVIRDELDGYLVPEGDVEALCQKVEMLMDNPKLVESLGNAGQQDVRNRFDRIRCEKEVVAYLRNII